MASKRIIKDYAVENFFGDDRDEVTKKYLDFLKHNNIDKRDIINVSHSISVLKARIYDSNYHSMYTYFSILLTYKIPVPEINECKKCLKLIERIDQHVKLGHK